MEIAKVVILSKYADIDGTLDYLIPSDWAVPLGSRVQVFLGNRQVEGIILGKSPTPQVKKLKKLLKFQPLLQPEFVKMVPWLARRAACSLAAVISAMLPPEASGEPQKRWQVDDTVATKSLTPKQALVVDWLAKNPAKLKSEIARALEISMVPINNLIDKGVLVASAAPITVWPQQPVTNLTDAQLNVLENILADTEDLRRGGEFLLHGVTGSGKTEVYIRLVQRVLSQGRQALVLVPEIALTAQLVARFRGAFGEEVTVLHSGLSKSMRAADWQRIARGDVNIVIGTRSAVFAPLSNLGLIVMDEEHEPAYKQEETPRYHARDIALFRGRWHRAAVVLGSATPALESFARAKAGRYTLLTMASRINSQDLVREQLIDMRRELEQGNRDMLSRQLQQELTRTLDRGEQALLFLNRRGVAPTVLCRSCGFRYSCPNCSTALTLHGNGQLKCHHCGASARLALVCPQCGGKYLRELGLGTQKLEARLRAMFPDISICRLDSDTASSATAKERQLHKFYQEGAGILLGTQMIAKGLDFPRVTLVGIVLADLSLGTDFRAAERTFQLVTQAAGRTGRSGRAGHVIIQTYQPEHYSLRYALAGDYLGFYRHEMGQRSASGMPPFSALTRMLVSSAQQQTMLNHVQRISDMVAKSGLELLYSGPAPLERLKGRYRWHFLLRHPGGSKDWQTVEDLRRQIPLDKKCRTVFDNNPHNFM